jgi:phage/plasmid-like protein (TIGR03299 family)
MVRKMELRAITTTTTSAGYYPPETEIEMPAEFESGFFVRTPAWHGEGVVLDDFPSTWTEARKAAGLNWEPKSVPMYGFSGLTDKGEITYDAEVAKSGAYFLVEEKQRVIRDDTGAQLGTPGIDYQVISHEEVGEIIEALLDADKNIQYETTVVLGGGKRVAVVIRLNEPINLPKDPSQTYPYLAVTTNHDGGGACNAMSTTVRIVCGNTFAAAETQAGRSGTIFSFRHSGSWRDKIEDARATILGLRADFEAYTQFAEEMTKIRVKPAQDNEFIEAFFPMAAATTAQSDRVKANISTARLQLELILESATCDGIRGTAWGWVQAAGEYEDHYAGWRNRQTYMSRQLIPGARRKLLAVDLAREVALAGV